MSEKELTDLFNAAVADKQSKLNTLERHVRQLISDFEKQEQCGVAVSTDGALWRFSLAINVNQITKNLVSHSAECP